MTRLILGRCLHAAASLLLLALIVFVLARAVGDPTVLLVPVDATPDQLAQARHDLGLDRPYYAQLGLYLGQLVRGDLGVSFRARRSNWELIADRLPKTLLLAGSALLGAAVLAFPLGVVAAARHAGRLDGVLQSVGVVGFAMPTFWLGLLLVQLCAVQLRWLPVAGYGLGKELVLPTLTLAVSVAATLMRLLRSSLLAILSEDFVRTATAKGLSRLRVFVVHALPNALVPVLTFGGVAFTQLLTGAVVVEMVFAWPGLGRLAVSAIATRDYPVIQAIVLVTGGIVILVNLIVDALYIVIDPRLRSTG